MDPTISATGPVYTYSPSERQNKASGSSIQNYIGANQPGATSNQAIGAAAEAARANSTVKGKAIAEYIAANRNVFNFTPANLAAGKSVQDYVAEDGVSSAASSASTASAQASAAEQGLSFQDYLNQAEGKASSAASSAVSSAASSATTAAQGSSAGMTIQQYFANVQGTSTTP